MVTRFAFPVSFAVPVVGLSLAAAGLALSCVDLFHSTDFETQCDLDAAGCPPNDGGRTDATADASDARPTDFCAWSSKQAKSNAEHACAWLGACSVPFDHNAFGPCMIDAIQAYDCRANPNRTIAAGPLHDIWDALWRAESCADVSHAIQPEALKCSGTGYGCAGGTPPTVSVECVGGIPGAESCLIQGKVCAGNTGCGPQGANATCTKSECRNNVLHDCEGTNDLGHDCTQVGAGMCILTDAGPACEPSAAHGSCAETNDVTCKGDTAMACAIGQRESIDCALLLSGNGSCKPGTPKPIWNIAAQCQGAGCAAGCKDADTLEGCAQGAAFTTSCKAQGLGPCHEVGLAGGAKGYACKQPP